MMITTQMVVEQKLRLLNAERRYTILKLDKIEEKLAENFYTGEGDDEEFVAWTNKLDELNKKIAELIGQ